LGYIRNQSDNLSEQGYVSMIPMQLLYLSCYSAK
jgi:hypothetical protein